MADNYTPYDLEELIEKLEIEIKNKRYTDNEKVYSEEVAEAFNKSKLLILNQHKIEVTKKLNLLQLQIINKNKGTVSEKYIDEDILSLSIKYFLMFGINNEELLKLDDNLLFPFFNAMRGIGHYQYEQCCKALFDKNLLDIILKKDDNSNYTNIGSARKIFNQLTDEIKAAKPTFEKEEDFQSFMKLFFNNYVYPEVGRDLRGASELDKAIQEIIDYSNKSILNASKVNRSYYERMQDKINALMTLKENSTENLLKVVEYHKFIKTKINHRFDITTSDLTLMTIIKFRNVSNENMEDLHTLVQKLYRFEYDLIEQTLNEQNFQRGK